MFYHYSTEINACQFSDLTDQNAIRKQVYFLQAIGRFSALRDGMKKNIVKVEIPSGFYRNFKKEAASYGEV